MEQIGQTQLLAARVRDGRARREAKHNDLGRINAPVDLVVEKVTASNLANIHPTGQSGALKLGPQKKYLFLAGPIVRNEDLRRFLIVFICNQQKIWLNGDGHGVDRSSSEKFRIAFDFSGSTVVSGGQKVREIR